MKKNLYEILDGAEPAELDLFDKESDVKALSEEVQNSIREKVYAKSAMVKEQKKAKNLWLRFGALAACLALIFGVGIVYFQDEDMPIFNILNIQTPFNAPRYYGSQDSAGSLSNNAVDADPPGISVTAKLMEVLPDVYTFYDDWNQYEFCLLKMETVKLLRGENMTKEFYYLVPVAFMTDFSVFDRFVMFDMTQFGFEYSVIYNKTKDKAEQLSLVLFAYIEYDYCRLGGKLMAFDSEGRMDDRLWNANQSWKDATERATTVETLIQAEEKAMDVNLEYTVRVNLLSEVEGETAEIVEWITSFENVVFVSRRISSSFIVERYINGFPTNERVVVYGKDWNRGGEYDYYKSTTVKFDEEDINALPDLSLAYETIHSQFEKGKITPSHLKGYEDMELYSYGIFGWYAKTEDGILGIIRVTWRYKIHPSCYDDAYFVIEYGSNKCKAIDRDDLVAKFGQYETTYISDEPYTENGLELMVVNV